MEPKEPDFDRYLPEDDRADHFEDCAAVMSDGDLPCNCEDLKDDAADVAAEMKADYLKENY